MRAARGDLATALRRSVHRWVYVLLGAALAVAFGLLLALPADAVAGVGLPWAVPAVVLLYVAPVALLGLLGAVRAVEGVAVSALLTGRADPPPPPSATWRQRARTSALLVVHVLAGGVVGALLVVGVPTAVLLVAAVAGNAGAGAELARGVAGVPLPDGDSARLVLAAVLVGAALVVGEGLGRVLAVLAPRLLAGPAAERLALAEAHVSVLAGRDRLARELHDSVGHSLSLVSIQAGAARRLVVHDPAGAQEALRATEDAARRALVDLDHVLGLLRDESADPVPPVPAPDLRDVDDLVSRARAAGAQVDLRHRGDVAVLPAVVSREAYRIVQEGLTNALRHARGASVTVVVDAVGHELLLLVEDAGAGATGTPGGGRGLVGVRERVRDLRGTVGAGPRADGGWSLEVRLPVRARSTS